MENWKNYTKGIHYNGSWMDKNSIEEVNLSDYEPWEREVMAFLQEWTSERSYIKVNTSGSTGKPKSIHLKKSTMVESALRTCNFLGINNGDSALLCLPGRFIGGKMMIVRSFVRNLNLQAIKPSSSPVITDHYTFAAMTPHQCEGALKKTPKLTDNVDILILGGSNPSTALIDMLQKKSNRVYLTFGMTETSSHIAVKKLSGGKSDDLFELISDDIILGLDDEKCLNISAPWLSASVIQTNDIVALVGQKHFKWLGRRDNVINSGGFKIHPEIIEEKLERSLKFRFIIFGVINSQYGERPSLLIESKKNLDIRPIQKILKTVLSSIEMPEDIYYIEKFEETANGKIDRKSSIKKAIKFNN